MNKTSNIKQFEWAVVEKRRLVERQDFVHITILMAIALVIGVYLIVTTVMISKDGVFYIERAQQFTSDPINIIKAHPPGFPFLILIAHKFVSLFTDNNSNQMWIYSAQGITLLCRLLALIPLYFIGKLLVGSKNSFWALLILIFLPYPAQFAADVVREWPYILFLACGFFFLLWAAKFGKWWAFSLVGFTAGLGYMIRDESAQLLFYGCLWLAIATIKPKIWNVSRWKNLLALALLVIGFAIPAAPYMKCTGRVIPPKVNHIMKSFSFNTLPDKHDVPKGNTVSSNYNTAEIVPGKVLKALGEIFNTIGENLMWFFVPALIIGLYYRFRGNAEREELILITAFIIVNMTMMVLRYSYIQLTVSRRWSLPLIAFTVFYIPVGLRIIEEWMNKKSSHAKPKIDVEKNRLSWFVILLLIGVGICMPKLLKPVRIEKQGYLDATNWLKENTKPEDIIAVPDRRLYFYAERKGLVYVKAEPKQASYIVRVIKSGDKRQDSGENIEEKYSTWVDKKESKKLVIYKVIR